MQAPAHDQVRTLYRTLLVFATVGVLLLCTGLVEFVHFEPPGQTSGIRAHIVGVYQYDPTTGNVVGSDRSQFSRTVEFAAVVDWSSLPSNLTVDARWYDGFGDLVGRAGPASPAELSNDQVIPVVVPQGLHHVLPGVYTFVVERLSSGVPVEVLGRRLIDVKRS